MTGFISAIKLEFNSMMERKYSLFFYLIAPVIIIAIFFGTATTPVNWGDYASLNLKIYDLFASDIFSIIIIFITTQIMVLRIVGERAPYGTLDRELIAISRSSMFLGKFVANFFYILIQCTLLFVSGFILFPARNYGSFPLIFLFILLIGVFGLISGLGISIFSKNKEQAVQLVPFYILILMLLSGILIPLEQMPQNVVQVAENFPLTLGASSLKTLTLDGVGFEDVSNKMILLCVWIFGIGFISLLKFKLERRG